MPKRTAILFFIPGNPGLSSYYTAFFDALRARIPGLDIITSNHLGFSPGDARREEGYIGLSAQVAHKVDLLDGIILGMTSEERHGRDAGPNGGGGTRNFGAQKQSHGDDGRIPIYIAGHSVGAYMATKVMQARPTDIKRAYLLFPTLSHISQSRNGRIAKRILDLPGSITVLSLLAGLLDVGVVSPDLRVRLVKWWTGFPDAAARVSALEVLTRNTVHTALTLAYTEMRDINAPDAEFLKTQAPRCAAYWARTDAWVSPESRDEIVRIAEGMENYICDEAPHAFCVAHNEIVAERVGAWMATDIKVKDDK